MPRNEEISASKLFGLLANHYSERPDDFELSIGHFYMPFPRPLSIYNMPEFAGTLKITMADVRRWATQSQCE